MALAVSTAAMRRSALLLPSLLAAALFAAGSVHASPVSSGVCGLDPDEAGKLFQNLDAILAANPDGTVDVDAMAANAAKLSASDRDRLASDLLALMADPDRAKAKDCDGKQPRYDAEAVLASLAANMPPSKRAALAGSLAELAKNEKDSSLRRQMALDLERLGNDALSGELSPETPPYQAIFGANGDKDVVHVNIHAGAETFEDAGYLGVFRPLGATVTKHSEHDWTIHWKVTPDDPTGRLKPVTYEIHIKDEFQDDFSNFDMFRDMKKESPEIEMYDFHSQYGSALDESLRDAAKNPDAQKLYILAACKSKVFTSRAQGLYPKTHFVTTEDGEYFSDTPRMLAKALQALANRESYSQLLRELTANDLNNYHLPNDRQQLEYLDLDGDGIADSRDTRLSCSLVVTQHLDSFAPKDPPAPALALAGEKVLHAVTVANGVIGYNQQIGSRFEDKFVSDGWGDADPNGPLETFTPAKDAKGHAIWKVKVNAAYSHLSDLALGSALTHDFALFGATNGGRNAPTLDDRILAFETGVDLLGAWDPDAKIWDAYQAKYNLGKDIDWWTANSALSHEDGATPETIAKIRKLLGRS